MHYTKPPYTIDQKAQLLIQRGLVVHDQEKLKQYLAHIGYFRLTGYCKYYQDPKTDLFYEGITFEQVLDTYIFDRKLRLLMLDVIEKIEVSIKASIGDHMSVKYENGTFWYLDSSLFNLKDDRSSETHTKLIQIIKQKKENSSAMFVKAYKEKYSEEEFLPSWMVFEELTIGEVSNLYKILNDDDAKEIATMYHTYFGDLKKRIQLLVNIRNITAHHARLRNRKFITKPRRKDVILKHKYTTELSENNTLEVIPNMFNASLIINYLLNQISPNHDFINKLEALFEEFPQISQDSMGFSTGRKQKFT